MYYHKNKYVCFFNLIKYKRETVSYLIIFMITIYNNSNIKRNVGSFCLTCLEDQEEIILAN